MDHLPPTPLFASRADIDGLFKFRPYPASDEGREYRRRVKETLLENKIFFSFPASFNDPFDPRPVFTVGSMEKLKYATEKHAKRTLPKNSPQFATTVRDILKFPRERAVALAAELTNEWRKTLRNDFSMYCMNSSRAPLLSWAHYADSHRGVCIHFDHKLLPFARALQVIYEADYPTIEYPIGPDPKTVYDRLLLRKSPEWSYESEFRLIRFPKDLHPIPIHRHMNLRWDGQFALLEPNCVTGITLGLSMEKPQREELLAIGATRDPPIPVYQADYAGDTFGLQFVPIR